ncbi:MAG: 3-deoxy-D-manno-octulosonic acid transferase [Gemmatales bacterium]|nr:3-deoxy-D-manno-octulosonic acid transferase [Gemmatales bacterium]MDW7993806.1 3-deoxy-D-manno-octulosonic acid transferase [Gemmatales bacterium]
MPNLLDALYTFGLAGALPYFIWQRWRHGKYRAGWWDKLTGLLPQRTSTRPAAWIHAVSVGEVLLLRPFITQMRQQYPLWELVITVGTETGYDVARRNFPETIVRFAPWDFTWAVANAFQRIRPNLLILVELELWPNWLAEAHRRQVPVVVINARLSQRSYRGYRRLGPWFARYLRTIRLWAVQNATYAERLRHLGVAPSRIVVTGSLKFDGAITEPCAARSQELARLFGLSSTRGQERRELVWVAGSTQEPEEEIVLRTYAQLQSRWPQLRLILVPRHRERFDQVARLIEAHGWPVLRRSQLAPRAADSAERQPWDSSETDTSHAAASGPRLSGKMPVILVDTIGELAQVWSLADVAFVGGSFSRRGGQNMLEPAALGIPVVFGPHVWNFQEIADALRHAQAAVQVQTSEQLAATLADLLEHRGRREQLGQRARSFVLSHQGAVTRTLKALAPWLGPAIRQAAA